MIGTPATEEASWLILEGAKALSRVEHVGIRVDEKHLKKQINHATERMLVLEQEMKKDPVYKIWRKRFGDKTNLQSREQFGHILFDELELEGGVETEGSRKEFGRKKKRRYKLDESVLQEIDLPFVQSYLEFHKYLKAKGTFLEGIQREVCDGLLHAIFNLNIARTYRSSSDSPNFQNFPIRDPILGKLIRSCFIPRKGRVLMEIDFKGVEVRVSACYNKDPVLIEYILDETKDMHRDMASQCYMVPPEEISKETRYCGKNMFVFPQFYGDYFINCARHMWEAIAKMSLTTKSGIPIGDVLSSKGIKELGPTDPRERAPRGTFVHHMKKVEEDFWGRRFKVYSKWKDKWYNRYLERGWFQMFTGFTISGLYSRNDVINYPVQGAAFHCLLWSLIKLQKWLIKNKMRSMIVGQIHDSLLLDVHKDEVEVVYAKAREIMTEQLLEHWGWIIVPMEIEVDIAETNWHEKHPFSIAA